MTEARLAVARDAEELVRLRAVMLAVTDGQPPQPGSWQAATVANLRERLSAADGDLVAFVVDRPERPDGGSRLAACAVGVVHQLLGGPGNPTGLVGTVLNVATDQDCRRRGYSTACMRALLDWFDSRGIATVSLHATCEGEPLYRALGFTDHCCRSMRRHVATSGAH